MKNIIGIIPARMGSSRFPGKPLKQICGIPMIGHVYLRSKMSNILQEVFVATPDLEIKQYIETIGGKAIMTSNKHERASDRCEEAMKKIEKLINQKLDIIVMIQGDEPLVYPEMIEMAVAPLLNEKDCIVANLMAEIETEEEFNDKNEIKVVVDKHGYALYMSRQPIPATRGATITPYKQVCIIPFKREALLLFSSLDETPLERAESIDMLRFLEHGYKVKMVKSPYRTISVDTEDDKIRAEKLMKTDPLIKSYSSIHN